MGIRCACGEDPNHGLTVIMRLLNGAFCGMTAESSEELLLSSEDVLAWQRATR